MDLTRLREETAALHAGTEESLPLMSDSLTLLEYVDCLRRFYRVVHAWDAWADLHAPADLEQLRQGRRRAALLAADLRMLGESLTAPQAMPAMAATSVSGNARAVFLGRMYVMEGSTLGGQYIAQRVEQRLGLTPGQGDSFFRGYGSDTSRRWQEFRSVLKALPDSDTDTVIRSARNMFELFASAMQSVPDGNGSPRLTAALNGKTASNGRHE